MRHRLLASVLLVAGLTASARADTIGWIFTFENDAVFRTDEYYTNGVEISNLREPSDVPAPVAATLAKLCGVFGGSCGPRLPGSFRLAFGNLMYTPRDINVAQIQPDDRPWAGWTYLGAVRDLIDKDGAQRDRLRTFDVRAGIIGPDSRSAEFQSETHRIIDVAQPRGWSNQISNRAGVMFRYEDKRAIPISTAPTAYLVPHAGIALGNVYRYLNAGAFLIFGASSRPFNFATSHAHMEPSVPHFNSVDHADAESSGRARPVAETSYFAGVDMRGIEYNLFLEGKSESRIEPRRFVYDYVAGARHVTAGGLIVSAAVIRRSEEFRGAGAEYFTSLSVGQLIQ